jgi:hypothetical protein
LLRGQIAPNRMARQPNRATQLKERGQSKRATRRCPDLIHP